MPRTSAVHAVTTIGIDMGKNTLHMIGLDTRGGIVLREKVPGGRITSRLATRFVPAKTNEQLDLQALHRVRSRLVSERTAVINQIRGFLLERGIIVRQGLRFLRQTLPDILAKRTDVSFTTHGANCC